MTVIVVIRGFSAPVHLGDHSVVLVDIIERMEIVVLRPGLNVDPHLALASLQLRAGPAELHTDVAVVVLRSLLGTDPAHDTPVETRVVGWEQFKKNIKHLKKLPPSS